MVYKRYIYRNGKRFGPYYYESYRDEKGIPRTRIVNKSKSVNKKILFLIFGITFLLLIFLILFLQVSISVTKIISNEKINLEGIESNVMQENMKVEKFIFEKIYFFFTGLVTDEEQEKTVEVAEDEINSETEIQEEMVEENKKILDEGEIISENLSKEEDIIEQEIEETNETQKIEINKTKQEVDILTTNKTFINETISNQTNIIKNTTINKTIQNQTNEYIENQTNKPITSPQDKIEINETLVVNKTIVNETVSNKTIINITETNLTIETTQYGAILNKPVKWKKKIKLDKVVEEIKVEIPKEAENISVFRISNVTDEKQEISEDKLLITGEVSAEIFQEKSFVIEFFRKIFNTFTGKVIEESKKTKEVVIENITRENTTEVEIEYETPGPVAFEEDTEKGKKIIISSEVHYENILAYTELPKEVSSESIRLYWLVNGSRKEVLTTKYDLNNNSLIDYVEWIVPHLSNQSYELEIIILNVQSYPTIGGNWTVKFNTTGQADLKITVVNGTTWSNTNEDNDLKFLEVKCGGEILNYTWIDNGPSNSFVFISNYSCDNQTGFETSKVLTPGKHHLEFDFGGIKALAHNWAGNPPNITWEPPTPNDGETVIVNSVYLNTTITDDNETSAFFDWNYSLLGYWSMDFYNSTGIFDNSTNNNFMVFGASGPSTSNITTGRYGNAMAFDGSNDYLKTTNDFVGDANSLTIASWIKKENRGIGTYECALHKGNGATIGASDYWMGVENSNNNLVVTIGASQSGIGWAKGRITPDTPAVYGQWYHLAATWDGSIVKIYLNGDYNKEYPLTTYANLATPTRIGASGDNGLAGTNYQFGGDVDEIMIWNRALSSEEINALYNNTANRLYHNFTGLGSGTYNYSAYVIDEDGNLNISKRNVIVATNNVPTTPTPEINSTDGSRFDTQNLNCYDTITDPDRNALNVTVEWYKDSVLNLTVDYNNTYANNYEFNAVLDSGNISAGEVWKCGIRVYDGALYSSWENSSGLTIRDPNPPIITWELPTPDDGNITENTYVYLNTTITDLVDTSAFFDWNKSLIGYWAMDFHNSTGVYDNSSYDNFGIFNGADFGESNITAGKYGNALEFDGVNDYINLGDTAEGNYDAMTIEAWIKRTSNTPSGWRTPLHRNDGTSVGSSVFFIGLESGTHNIVATIGAGSGAGYMAGDTNIFTELDTWYHVVNSWDGTTARVYIDGVKKVEYGLLSTNFNNKPAVTRIGASGNSAGYLFNGEIDEVKIYSRALSPEEINASYNNKLYGLYHNFTNLAEGTYDYFAYAIDAGGNLNITQERNVIVEVVGECSVDLDCDAGKWCNSSYKCVDCTVSECIEHSHCRNGSVCCDDDIECGSGRICVSEHLGTNGEACSYAYSCRDIEDLALGTVMSTQYCGHAWWSGDSSGQGNCGEHAYNVPLSPEGDLCIRYNSWDADFHYDAVGVTTNHDTNWEDADPPSGGDVWWYNYIYNASDLADFHQIEIREWDTGFTNVMYGYYVLEVGATDGEDSTGCCDDITDCVDDSLQGNVTEQYGCYDNSTLRDTGGGDGIDNETCLSGIWYAQDSNSTACAVSGNIWSSTYSCCNGDDSFDECDEDSDCAGGYICQSNCTCVQAPDNEYPQFSSLTETPSDSPIYSSGANYEFNITITSTNGTAGIEFDGTNYTMTNLTLSLFNWTTTDLSVGTYNYHYWSFGNGTSYNYNISATYDYTINQAISEVNLTLNKTQGNISVTNNTFIDLNCSTITGYSGAYLELWNNGTLINNGTSPIGNTTLFDSVGLYNITCVYEETTNYLGGSETWWVNVTSTEVAISIDLSSGLSQQISWNLASLPIYNQSADGNNNGGATGYYINISVEGGTTDLYIKASGDLITQGLDVLGLGNETFSFNLTNSSVPSLSKSFLTTDYLDNLIGSGLSDGSVVYLKFFLNAPPAQSAGTYNNSLLIKAVPNGESP
jgi:hypothetical protein